MGLNCSHGAFDGAYSAFNRFRQVVCRSIEGTYPPHYKKDEKGNFLIDDGYYVVDDNIRPDRFFVPDIFSAEKTPGIWEFLTHSDCDGSITPTMCKKVADELEKYVLPNINKYENESFGHIERAGGHEQVLINFIEGCRLAHKKRQCLRFG